MDFKLTSSAFENGAVIPPRHTCNGEDASPSFEWHGAPEEAKSFARTLPAARSIIGQFSVSLRGGNNLRKGSLEGRFSLTVYGRR